MPDTGGPAPDLEPAPQGQPFVPPPGMTVKPGIRMDESPCWVAHYGLTVAIANTPEEAARRAMA